MQLWWVWFNQIGTRFAFVFGIPKTEYINKKKRFSNCIYTMCNNMGNIIYIICVLLTPFNRETKFRAVKFQLDWIIFTLFFKYYWLTLPPPFVRGVPTEWPR